MPTHLRRPSRQFIDGFFFVFAGLATFWLAVLTLQDTFDLGWWGLPLVIVIWALLAYLALPRLHRILTSIYVPDYFLGRARTSDGLLGDPINLAMRGSEARLHEALQQAGWTRADDLTLRSSVRIVATTLTRRSYDEAPVSPLFLFGRQQDFAYQQEVAGNPAKRHHVRFWKCPDGWLLPGGTRVDWLAAGTFDRAVGLSLFTLQITHKIDENTDVERDHIIATLLDADIDASVSVLQDFSTGYHARNGGGDTIRTDGDLPVVDLRSPDTAIMSTAPAVLERTSEDASSIEAVRRHGRPAAIVFGAVIVFLRAAITGIIAYGLATLDRRRFITELSTSGLSISDPIQIDESHLVLVLVTALIAVVSAALGVMLLRGSDLARIILLIYAAATTLVAFLSWLAGDPFISNVNSFTVVALNILILLALSGTPARAFTTQPRLRAPLVQNQS